MTADEEGEAQLMQRIADRDEAALGALYDRYANPLYAMVHRIVGSRQDAEEIIHDTFLSIWKRAESFEKTRAKVFTWICAVARNKAIDRIRSINRRIPTAPAEEPKPYRAETDPAPSPAAQSQMVERRQIVKGWVSELPEKQREAIELAFFDGLTHPEIASRCGESVGTIKSRIRLGMEKLRSLQKGGLE